MLKVSKVVGLNSDQSAAQALVVNLTGSRSGEENTPVPEIHLFICVRCTSEDAFTRARAALSEAEDAFTSDEGEIIQKLHATMDSLKVSLSDVTELQVLMAGTYKDALSARTLYLLNSGSGMSAYLGRADKMINLLDMAENETLISGFMKEGDKVWLFTDSLKQVLGEDLNELFKFSVDLLEDEVNARLPQDQINPLAAIFIEEEIPPKTVEDIEEEGEIPFVGSSGETGKTSRLPEVAASVLSTVLAVKNAFLEKLSLKDNRPVYLSGPVPEVPAPTTNRRVPKIAILIVLMLVLLGGFFKFSGGQKLNPLSPAVNSDIAKAEGEYNQALLLKDGDTFTSQQKLESAKILIEAVLQKDPNNTQAQELNQKITANWPEIYKISEVGQLPVWLDLGLIKDGFVANRLSVSMGRLLLLDTTKNVLVSVNLENKSQQLLAGEDKLGKTRLVTISNGLGYVLTASSGILKVDTDLVEIEKAVDQDEEWGEIADIFGYASNIYLLDKGNPPTGGQIWKYIPVEKGFAEKRAYFAEDVSANLQNAIRMQVDGSIWILNSDGTIFKFTQGVKDDFALKNMPSPTLKPRSFYLSDDTDNLYLLDSGNNRLLVFDKNGQYKLQYQSDKFAESTDLIVDEKGKKAYLLEGSRIYQMELK